MSTRFHLKLSKYGDSNNSSNLFPCHHDKRLIKISLGREGFFFQLLSYSPSWKETKERTQSRNLEAGMEVEVKQKCFWLSCSSSLAKFVHLYRAACPGVVPPTECWLPITLISKCTTVDLPIGYSEEENFLIWGSFFQGDSDWCQIHKN